MDNNTVLITGGHGFVGKNLWEYIASNPELLTRYKFYRFSSKQFDLRSFAVVNKLFKTYQPTHVIHLAARCGGIGANMMAPATFWNHNIVMGANLLECSAAYGVKKFITLGTVCSYGKNAQIPFKEEQLYTEWPEITNRPYGVAKLAIYEGCRAYESEFELPFTYLIPTNMYGPHDWFGTQTSHVIPAMLIKMIRAVKNKEHTIELWGDGTPTRDFLYVKDTCRAIMASLDIDTGTQPINLGSGKEISMKGLAEALAVVTGYKGEIVWNTEKPNGQPRRAVDYSKAKELLMWEPETSLLNGLLSTYNWAIEPSKLAEQKEREAKEENPDLGQDDKE